MIETHRQPNRLIHEASPYLLQHAHNPVDWYPWGEEALSTAKRQNKPILLSVGYSSCHWCHVMERESFENEAIAAIMNEHFVNIKVDREERPDLDHIYQTVCQMVTQQGGWPLTVFLTPDLKPFYVGTYYPPDDRFGRPGFTRVLMAVAAAYRERRSDVEGVAENWTHALGQAETLAAPTAAAPPEAEIIRERALELAGHVDRTNGGLGGAPKFPNPEPLALMLRAHRRTGAGELLELVELTLRKMAHGGIYDQLGGGFHRYSVNARWTVPHFEKMLYDNALLPPVYLAAWQITRNPLYERIVRETLAYVEREMLDPRGGFYSTQDADSEGEEGLFFVWTPAQVAEVLGPVDGELICRHLGITPKGNFEDGTTVLTWAAGPEELGVTDQRLRELKDRLWAAREQRTKPGRDDKVLTGWNGLMITAFARAATVLGDDHCRQVARRAADFVLAELSAPDGGLLRRWKDGKAAITGYLEDYAYLTQALLDVHEATLDEQYLQAAERLNRETVRRFWDGQTGGFFSTEAGVAGLIHRPREVADSATPAANSIATLNLLRLLPFTGETADREKAEQVFRAHRPHMERMAWGMSSLLAALDFYLSGGTEVTLVGPADAPEVAAWARELGTRYLPNLVLTRVDPPGRSGRPIWTGKTQQDGRPTLYVCKDFACSPPATDWSEAAAWLS